MPLRTRLATLTLALTLPLAGNAAGTPAPEDWNAVVRAAKGQTVYFNAWGGERTTNDYIAWAADQVEDRYGIDLVHVKLSDTSEAVSRVIAEKQAGNDDDGAIDLIWINGENFAALKKADLLFGPWAENLPNFSLTDPENSPAARTDFTVPVEGYESPWGKAQVVFYYDKSLTENPPRSMDELLQWSKQHPGEFTYAKPPQFLGTTFLKQALLELVDDPKVLYSPVSEADFDKVTAPLWEFLDKLHPNLWRSGRAFADNGPAMRRLMADGEVSLAYAFNPTEAASAIANNELPPSVQAYVLDAGTIGNYSFLAIPYNAKHAAGAMVVANFMLSPEAQARKQSPDGWGNSTVLAMDKLNDKGKAAFEALPKPVGAPTAEALQNVVPEPHASWVDAIEEEWQARYVGQ